VLNVRKDLLPFYTDIQTREIYNASRMVSTFTGFVVQPNKAIVGKNAFAHESGIHQDGVLKDRNTYEIMRPEDVGVPSSKIVLGRHSGRHGLKARLQQLGFHLAEQEMDRVYERFLNLADKKKEVYDEDLRSLMGEEVFAEKPTYSLDYLHVFLGTNAIPTATVRLSKEGEVVEESAIGDGPVDAVFNAIDRALKTQFEVTDYQVRSVTSGRDAMGEVFVRIQNGLGEAHGRGHSTDIIEASGKAYLQAINEIMKQREKSETEVASSA
ncbi:MAG: 2-isopropylmalate synthase, partial [Caldisericaceae bacterium]|nr:2-isopropylmalate synthase [Caldisericaceae bacterium]